MRQPKNELIFSVQGMASGELEEWEKAQYLLDGLTIKHVHLETGTPAFYIQHCHGTNDPSECGITKNCQPGLESLRPIQKNECAVSVIPFEQWQSSLVKTKASGNGIQTRDPTRHEDR